MIDVERSTKHVLQTLLTSVTAAMPSGCSTNYMGKGALHVHADGVHVHYHNVLDTLVITKAKLATSTETRRCFYLMIQARRLLPSMLLL